MSELAGETAVVTGAAQGIGRRIAETLADRGAHVVVSDIQDGTEAVESIEDAGGSAEFREGDVTDEESMRAVFEGLSVDILVNNAAYYAPLVEDKKRFDEIDEEEWDQVMAVNSKGVFIASKAAVPSLGENSRIVNVSSGVVLRGTPGFMHYVASKAAVIGITRAMANELGEEGVRVNAITPGLTASEATLQAGEDLLEKKSQGQAIQRPIEPRDIASAIALLCDPETEMITGQVLNVDGGSAFY